MPQEERPSGQRNTKLQSVAVYSFETLTQHCVGLGQEQRAGWVEDGCVARATVGLLTFVN